MSSSVNASYSEIKEAALKVIGDNLDKVSQYKKNPALFGWFFGQVMKATNGKANPISTAEILTKMLEKAGPENNEDDIFSVGEIVSFRLLGMEKKGEIKYFTWNLFDKSKDTAVVAPIGMEGTYDVLISDLRKT